MALKARNLLILISLVAGCVFSGVAAWTVHHSETALAEAQFKRAANDRILAVRRVIEENLRSLRAVQAFMANSIEVERSEFTAFVSQVIGPDQHFQAVEWIPKVPAAQRMEFERTARADGFEDFTFTERESQGAMRPARPRDVYFPVFFVDPMEGNEAAFGFDLGSDRIRREALETARDLGTMVASSKITLVQEKGDQPAFLVFAPVFGKERPTDTIAEREAALKGFVLGVIRISDMVDDAFGHHDRRLAVEGIDLYLYDNYARPGRGLLWLHHSRARDVPDAPALALADAGEGRHVTHVTEFAGRSWSIVARPMQTEVIWQSWAVLGGGLVVTALIAVVMGTLLNRTEVIRTLVETRTAELRQANKALRSNDRTLTRLHEITSSPADLGAKLGQLLELGCEVLGLQLGIVSRVSGNVYVVERAWSAAGAPEPGTSFMLGETYCMRTIGADGPIGFHHVAQSEIASHPCYAKFGLESYLGVPLVVDGERFGTLNFSSPDPRPTPFADRDYSLMRLFAQWVEAELSRQRNDESLRASNTRTQAILNSVVDGIITIDARGTIEVFNPAAERIFGHEAHEMIGANVRLLMPEPTRSEHDAYLARYTETGRRSVIGSSREVTGLRKDGSTFPMSLAVSEIMLHGEKRFTGIVRDITQRKEVERLKSEFVSTVSHELRTPLTSIMGSLGLVRSGAAGALEDKARSLLDIAYNNSERLVRLINDILDIEKIASGRMEFRRDDLDLVTLIHESLEANKGFAERHQVTLDFTADVRRAAIEGDRDRLMQVMANLLSNAVKYSPEGGTVSVRLEELALAFRISVHDDGPGIPEEFHDKIFSRFSQADSSDTRKKGGTGLGLNITQAIVENHRGRIDFDCPEGRGTTFNVMLPTPIRATPTVACLPEGASARRILICEDDPDIARLLVMILGQEGFEADVAPDADTVRAHLSKRRYAAMTLDLGLPGEDGIDLFRDLRANPETHELPVIVVSARAAQGEAELNGDAVNVIDWLEKPIDRDRLSAALHAAIRGEDGGRPRILHVEDDVDVARIVSALVDDLGDLETAGTLAEAREHLARSAFDLVILDLMLPDGAGEDLLPLLNRDGEKPTPVLVFSARELRARSTQGIRSVLVKSQTSNEDLVRTIRAAVGGEQITP